MMIWGTNMTYGEKRIQRLESINFKKEIEDITDRLEDKGTLPPRLTKEEAVEYYGNKLKKAFESVANKKQDDVQPKLKVTMLS